MVVEWKSSTVIKKYIAEGNVEKGTNWAITVEQLLIFCIVSFRE